MNRMIILSLAGMLFLQSCSTPYTGVKPTPQQVAWAEAEIGVIITYDINIYAPDTYKESNPATLPDLKVFNPRKLNTDQWLEAAASLGAKYAVLVAKHGSGFTLWPSKAHGYHVGNTPWRNGQGDIVADFIQSCKKYGIKPGMYYNTGWNTYFGAIGNENIIKNWEEEKKNAYNQVVLQQITELWTQYGPQFELWFDGGVMRDEDGGIASSVVRLIETHQPGAVLFCGQVNAKNLVRWSSNESGYVEYPNWSTANRTSSEGHNFVEWGTGTPDGEFWAPAEADIPNRRKQSWCGGWLWRADEEKFVFPAEDLVNRYYNSVGRNANLLVGMVIDTAGLFPEYDKRQFELAGKEIKRRFGKSIAETSGKGETVGLKIGKQPTAINHIVIQEDIANGERIRKYVVEANVNGQWIAVCDGESVGHKRIQQFDAVTTNEIRLRVVEAVDVPLIKRLAVYHVTPSE